MKTESGFKLIESEYRRARRIQRYHQELTLFIFIFSKLSTFEIWLKIEYFNLRKSQLRQKVHQITTCHWSVYNYNLLINYLFIRRRSLDRHHSHHVSGILWSKPNHRRNELVESPCHWKDGWMFCSEWEGLRVLKRGSGGSVKRIDDDLQQRNGPEDEPIEFFVYRIRTVSLRGDGVCMPELSLLIEVVGEGWTDEEGSRGRLITLSMNIGNDWNWIPTSCSHIL